MGPLFGFVLGLLGAFVGVRRALTRAPEAIDPAEPEPTQSDPGPGRTPGHRSSGIMPDEQLTDWLRAECRRLDVDVSRVDFTTVDGIVYLRGRETDPGLVDTLVSLARSAPGARDVVDEVKRE